LNVNPYILIIQVYSAYAASDSALLASTTMQHVRHLSSTFFFSGIPACVGVSYCLNLLPDRMSSPTEHRSLFSCWYCLDIPMLLYKICVKNWLCQKWFTWRASLYL